MDNFLLRRIPRTQEVNLYQQWIYAQTLKRCPYCLEVSDNPNSTLLHLMEHFKGKLRVLRLQTLAEKESDILLRCRCQCKFNFFPTTTQDQEANDWYEYLNKTHVAMTHYYGEDQMLTEENQNELNRCLFRCKKFVSYGSHRDRHEETKHQGDQRLFTDEYRLRSRRCLQRCPHIKGHFGHPEADSDVFLPNHVKQCRKLCMGYRMTTNRRNTW